MECKAELLWPMGNFPCLGCQSICAVVPLCTGAAACSNVLSPWPSPPGRYWLLPFSHRARTLSLFHLLTASGLSCYPWVCLLLLLFVLSLCVATATTSFGRALLTGATKPVSAFFQIEIILIASRDFQVAGHQRGSAAVWSHQYQ